MPLSLLLTEISSVVLDLVFFRPEGEGVPLMSGIEEGEDNVEEGEDTARQVTNASPTPSHR